MMFKGLIGEGRFTLGPFYWSDLKKMLRLIEQYNFVLQDDTDSYGYFKQKILSPNSIWFTGRDDKRVVGYGGFSNIERGRDALCFIYSQRANPGTLYFARLAIAFAFKEFNLQRVTTTCPAINRAASIFNRKIGFKLEGEHRASWLHEGFLYSTYLFGLLREEAEKWDLKL